MLFFEQVHVVSCIIFTNYYAKTRQATDYNNLSLWPQYETYKYGTNQNTLIFFIYRERCTNILIEYIYHAIFLYINKYHKLFCRLFLPLSPIYFKLELKACFPWRLERALGSYYAVRVVSSKRLIPRSLNTLFIKL